MSAEGEVFIGYAASLRWGWLRLRAMTAIECGADGCARQQSTLRGCREPVLDGDSLRWTASRLGVSASWAAPAGSQRPGTVRLIDTPDGYVDWTCLLPRAVAAVEIGGRKRVDGLGYAERLDMTLRPWQLPIDELRWGRYLAANESVVWIEWRGPQPLRLLVHNGVMVEGAMIADTGPRFADAEIQLQDSRVLREGRLGSTALRPLGLLRRLLPRRLLAIHERKWVSRGKLVRAGDLVSEGWAIHEVVRWR